MKSNLLKTTKPLKVEGWYDDVAGDEPTIFSPAAKDVKRYWAVLVAESLLQGIRRRGNVN